MNRYLLSKLITYIIITLFIFLSIKSIAQPGSLDSSFSENGKATTFKSGSNFNEASCVQDDGKIIVGGSSSDINAVRHLTLVRYLTNGKLDSSFDKDGKVITPFQGSNIVTSIIIQPNGKILAGGTTSHDEHPDDASDFSFFLACYLSNGSLDSSFGINGFVTKSVGFVSGGKQLLLQPNGKILFLGSATTSEKTNLAVVRYNTDGSFDSTFGKEGVAQTSVENIFGLSDMILQQNGKITLRTGTRKGLTFFQLNSNGSPDNSFGENGKLKPGIKSYSGTMILQNNDKIIVTGDTTINGKTFMMLVRFKLNGHIDSTFGENGRAIEKIESSLTGNALVAVGPDANLIVLANQSLNGVTSFELFRFSKTGQLDLSFGNNGKVVTRFGNPQNEPYSLVIQKDGKIIASGITENLDEGLTIYAVARYNISDVTLPGSLFSFSGNKKENTVLLNWQTENEISNDYFIMEKTTGNDYKTGYR